jgi:ATP/maltotriose-dependent transcriptional regulator MalT/DNA-binding XRE family transcriptional regulator
MYSSPLTTTFGDLLRYLRRRARLTQRELALAVGYTEAHICRLEKNQRPPDLMALAALFGPALRLDHEPEAMSRLLDLAAHARGERRLYDAAPAAAGRIATRHAPADELGVLENPPPAPSNNVVRAASLERLRTLLAHEKGVAVCGLAGMGKTALAAAVVRDAQSAGPVFWCTLVAGVTATADSLMRHLALFLLAHGNGEVRPLVERRADAQPAPLEQQLGLLSAALARSQTLPQAGQPAPLLCFDDVHLLAGDTAALTVLHHLHNATPARLLLTSREDAPVPGMAQFNLPGLERDEALDLIGRLDLPLAHELRERLIVRTGGNPMLLRLAAGQLLSAGPDAAGFVEHLEAQPQVAAYIFDTMLRGLSHGACWWAALVAVFRRPIDLYDQALLDLARAAGGPVFVDRVVAELARRNLIEHGHWATLHPLVRDRLYATLADDAPLRKRLHRVAAAWSEQAGDDVEAAYHFCRAGDVARATELIADQSAVNRGQAARALDVVDEALVQLRRKRGNTTAVRRRLLTARGDLLRSTLRAAEAEDSYREALALAQDNPAVRADVVRRLALGLLQRGQTAESLRLCQSAAAELSPADTVLLARLASVQCRALVAVSRYEEAEQVAQRALELAARFEEYLPHVADEVRVRAERTLGWAAYTREPESPRSLEHYRRGLAAARRAGLPVLENACLNNIAITLIEQGDLEGGLQAYEEALRGGDALNDSYLRGAVLHNIAGVHKLRGALETALATFEEACAIERRLGDFNGLLSTEDARAGVLVCLGRIAEARAALDVVLRENQEQDDLWTRGSCLCTLAEVQVLQGETAAAQATARRVLGMTGIDGNARIRTTALDALALAHVAAGENEPAQRIVAGGAAPGVGLEIGLRHRLVECVVALAVGDAAGGAALAREVARRSAATGCGLFGQAAERLLRAGAHTPPAALVRALLVQGG